MRLKQRGFTVVEILVVIAIMAILMAILVPVLEKGRENALAVKCASNLRQVGQAIAMYANDNHGAYPRTMYDPKAPPTWGTNPAAANPFAAGGPAANDVTAALFLLIRTQRIPPIIFTCPYTDVNVFEEDRAADLISRSNFTDYRKNLGYSYANPYPDEAAANADYRLTNHGNPGMAIAADLNSGRGGKFPSDNHEDRGQNVLYADGHVTWQQSPFCGVNDDNIYMNKNNVIAASPVDASDSVLLPAKK